MDIAPYQCRFGTYSLAGPHDHAALAALLRSNPMHGDIRLALCREPDFSANRNPFGKRFTVIGRSPQGTPMFLCEAREYPAYIAGKVAKVVYLGLLRVAREYRRQLGILEHGFIALRGFARKLECADDFFTVVPYGNEYTRTVLEAGISKLPRCTALGDMHLLLLPTHGSQFKRDLPESYSIDSATPDSLKDIEGLLAASGSPWSYAPAIHSQQLANLFSNPKNAFSFSDMLILRHKGLAVGCVGVWDQRGQRQQLVDGYSAGTAILRPFYNMLAGIRKTPLLPAPGDRLELVFLPFFCIRHNHLEAGAALLHQALQHAGAKGAKVCSLAFSEQNALYTRLPMGGSSWRLRVYRVVFPGSGKPAEGRFFSPQPDLALL